MYSRSDALRKAVQYRTCPPADVANDPSCRNRMKKHRAVCSDCFNETHAVWTDLVRSLGSIFTPARIKDTDLPPAPGQLRYIRKTQSAWTGFDYYNAPMVLVLQSSAEIPGAILAAQTYHDPAMAGPGDIVLTDGVLPSADIFIESWNIYPVAVSHLAPVTDTIPLLFLNAVSRLAEKREDYPHVLIRPVPMKANDPRMTFRAMEVRIGRFFSITGHADPDASLQGKILNWMDDLLTLIPDIRWTMPPENLFDIVAYADLPADRIPKAAGDDNRESATARMIHLENRRIRTFEMIPVIVRQKTLQDQVLFVGCELVDLPDDGDITVDGYWITSDNLTIKPEESTWDGRTTGIFSARFRNVPDLQGKLEFVVICSIGKKK